MSVTSWADPPNSLVFSLPHGGTLQRTFVLQTFLSRTVKKRNKIMKCKLALRIATSPSDRWLRKAADWNPELSTRYRINTAIGRPRKRWEDDINEFLEQEFEDTKNPIESSNQTNKTWISIAKDCGSWALLEEAFTMTVEERQEMRK